MKAYNPHEIEPRWQKAWDESGLNTVREDESKPKKYVLEMFPYPSGDIHMGHVRNYTIGDVIARYSKMRGFDVLHPMGWDAFGLPAENAAIKHHSHPAKWTYANIETQKASFKRMGLSYDWDRTVVACDPEYYRWGQWIFLQFWKRGLVERRESPVNWCPNCKTVLANEQVTEGECWRCHGAVEKRDLTQWYFKITDYAQELLDDLDQLDGWPERVKQMQANWIGRSEGAEVDFELLPAEGKDDGQTITVFTTRPDTLFGCSFFLLAPESKLVPELVGQARILLHVGPGLRDDLLRIRALTLDVLELVASRSELLRGSVGSSARGVRLALGSSELLAFRKAFPLRRAQGSVGGIGSLLRLLRLLPRGDKLAGKLLKPASAREGALSPVVDMATCDHLARRPHDAPVGRDKAQAERVGLVGGERLKVFTPDDITEERANRTSGRLGERKPLEKCPAQRIRGSR